MSLFVVIVHNNDKQYKIEKERLRESRDIDLMSFSNVPASTEKWLYFGINDLGLHQNIYCIVPTFH